MSVINSLVTWVKVAVGYNSLMHTHTLFLIAKGKSRLPPPPPPQSLTANGTYLVIEDVLNVVENGLKIKSKKVTH
jgi:hypothetical protein